MADYEWQENLACEATYAVFTNPGFGQLDPDTVSFADAGARTMGSLPLFNHAASASLRYEIALLQGREFLLYLKEIHRLVKQTDDVTVDKLYDSLAGVLSTADATISTFAGVVDANLKFPDEAQSA